MSLLRHEAFFYSSWDEYVATLVPFLAEGLAAGDEGIVATTQDRIELLREGMGEDAPRVTFVDALQWYARPGAALVAWREAVDARMRAGAPRVRGIGEVQFGDAPTKWARCESLLSRAFADRPTWIICPYDTRTLSEDALAAGRQAHPMVLTATGRVPSGEHEEIAAPLVPAEGLSQGPELRGSVVMAAHRAGLPGDVAADLALAISELTGGRPAKLRAGSVDGEWHCDVELPAGPVDGNLGVSIGRIICDRVELAEREDGSLVRFVFTTARDPRQRILAAAAELFRRDGVRATGVNAVIEAADVAKATFYAQFASKDELVLAWLRSPRPRWLDAVQAEVEARAASPTERLATFFEVIGEWLAADDFLGCPFIRTAVELPSSEPAQQARAAYLADIREALRHTAEEAHLEDPEGAAEELLLLVLGTISAATATRSGEPAVAASRAAALLAQNRRPA